MLHWRCTACRRIGQPLDNKYSALRNEKQLRSRNAAAAASVRLRRGVLRGAAYYAAQMSNDLRVKGWPQTRPLPGPGHYVPYGLLRELYLLQEASCCLAAAEFSICTVRYGLNGKGQEAPIHDGTMTILSDILLLKLLQYYGDFDGR